MAENNGENSRETQDAERQLIVLRAKERNRPFILARPNVIGLDVGYRVRGGKPTDELVVIAYVSQKVDRSLLREVDLVPASVRVDEEEVPVDVVESSVPRALTYTVRSRPLRGGNSIFPGVISDLAGTCGICVTIGGATLILSNNHVLADSNSLPIGSPIVQPGTLDGGAIPADVVATLTKFVPIDFGTTTISLPGGTSTFPNPNDVDAAVATVIDGKNAGNREIHWIGYPSFLAADPSWSHVNQLFMTGMRVCKMGRTTDFTTGTITSGTIDISIGGFTGAGSALFVNQLQIEGDDGLPFAAGGDSGSLVVTLDPPHIPVGLLFAGTPTTVAFANPIHKVMNALGIPRI